MGRPRGRPKGSRNKQKPVWRDLEISPFDYLKGVLNQTHSYTKERFDAANALMPFIYPKLSATKIDADVTNHASSAQVTEAHRLVITALAVPVETNAAANGHANGSGNGAPNGGLKDKQ